MLQIPADLEIPEQTQPFLNRVELAISETDAMYAGNDRHYLSCGASALSVIISSLQLAGLPTPGSVLDFGAGAGRVTRWLRAAFPEASVDVCDLRPSDIDFCAEKFNANSWISSTDVFSLHAPRRYDLIWLGSVVTHLSAAATHRVIERIASWCRPGGLVVVSFHGRYALGRQNSGNFTYIDDEQWTEIQREYYLRGFGYADYPGQNGYGISITKPSWMASAIEQKTNLRLVCLSEKAWDSHHDVVAFQVVSSA